MKKRLELQPEMTNVLALENSQAYRCRVVGYVLERSLLIIEITHQEESFYAIFPEVHYYGGIFLWQGATLRTASRDEQFEYMLEQSIVASVGMLYIFEGADCTVKVLGGEWIAIFEDLPDRFKSL